MGNRVYGFYEKGVTAELAKLSADKILHAVGNDVPEDCPRAFKDYLESVNETCRRRVKAFVLLYNGNLTATARKIGISSQMAHRYMHKPAIREAIQDRAPTQVLEDEIARNEELFARWTEIGRDPSIDVKDRLKADELLGKSRLLFADKVVHEGGENPLKVHHADLTDRIANVDKGERATGAGGSPNEGNDQQDGAGISSDHEDWLE